MGIRHSFVSAKVDNGDTSLVRPSDWNATHNSVPQVVCITGASLTVTNIPSAATEFPGLYRTKVDLTYADQVRFVVRVGVAGNSTAVVKLQYSTDQSAWSNLTTTAALNAVATVVTAWQNVPAGAQADVFVRALTSGGDGVADPQIRLMQLQVK